MSDIVPHIVSRVLHSHRTLCHKAIAITCIAGTPDPLNDPLEIRSFRYQALNKIYEIYHVNLTLSNRFDRTDPGVGDDYYLDIIERAFGELDNACMVLNGLLSEVTPANLSVVSRRIIEVWAYTSRLIPEDVTLHLGSLQTITAEPLPSLVLEQISIISEFFADIHKARTLFTEVLRRPETLTEDWESCGFRSRSYFIRQVLVPIAMTQFSGAAHFIRWLAIGWSKTARPYRIDATPFHARDVIYDPERHLKLDSYNPARVHLPIRLAPWTAQFRGVWTYPEVGSYCRSLIHQQEASVAGQTLATRHIQIHPHSSQKRVLAFRGLQGPSTRTSSVTADELPKTTEANSEIQPISSINVAETRSKQNAMAACHDQGNAKLEIAKVDKLSKTTKNQNSLICPHCSIRICLPKDLDRHMKTKHGGDGKVYYCPVKSCKRSKSQKSPFDRLDNWRRHVQTVHKILKPTETDVDVVPLAQDSEM